MKFQNRKKAILSGMGSLLVLMPGTDYAQFVPKQSGAERMRSHWESVGGHLRSAVKSYESSR